MSRLLKKRDALLNNWCLRCIRSKHTNQFMHIRYSAIWHAKFKRKGKRQITGMTLQQSAVTNNLLTGKFLNQPYVEITLSSLPASYFNLICRLLVCLKRIRKKYSNGTRTW